MIRLSVKVRIDVTSSPQVQPAVNSPTPDSSAAVAVLQIEAGLDLTAPEVRREALETLEGGGVIYLPQSGFSLSKAEQALLADLRNFLTDPPDIGNGRPTIIFEPARGRIRKLNFAYAGWRPVRAQIRAEALPPLERMMARYSAWAEDLIARLFPHYVAVLERDRVTYRPNQRSAVQPLHVDAAYGDPTQGRGMLRVFCNIDPLNRPRVWQIGEPFETFAGRFLPAVQPRRPSWSSALLARVGAIAGSKTAYDMLLADLRGRGKHDADYQRTAPRRIVEFPPGCCWLAITDKVLHGALSGQHSLDQTFYLPAAGMHDPTRSSLRILERLSGRRLV